MWKKAKHIKTGEVVRILQSGAHKHFIERDGKKGALATSKLKQYEFLEVEDAKPVPVPVVNYNPTVIINRPPIVKYEQWRSKAMLDLCRSSPCISCGKPPRSEASHRNSGDKAMSKKASDMTIPLCWACHQSLDTHKVKDSDWEWLKLHWKWHLQLFKEGKLHLSP